MKNVIESNRNYFYRISSVFWLALSLICSALYVHAQTKPSPAPNADFYRTLADAELKKNDYEKAIEDYTKAINLNPKDSVALYRRGFAYHYTGDFESARQDYSKALGIEPKYGYDQTFNCVFSGSFDIEFLDAYLNDCNEAIRKRPDFALAYYQRGKIYRAQNYAEKALSDFLKAIELAPNFYSALLQFFSLKKDFANVIIVSNKALTSYPKSLSLYITRGTAYFNLEQYNEAIADFTQYIKLVDNKFPFASIAYLNRGAVYLKQHNYDAAIGEFDTVLRMDYSNADAHNSRGLAFFKKGDYDRAIRDYTNAINLNQKKSNFFKNRAAVYEEQKNYDAARADYQKSYDLDHNETAKKKLQYFLNGRKENITEQSPVLPQKLSSKLDLPSQEDFDRLKSALKLNDIFTALQFGKAPLPELNQQLIKSVKEKGVSFEISAWDEKTLKNAGATPDLITAIKQESEKAKLAIKYKVYFDDLNKYTAVINLDPSDTNTYYKRGMVYRTLEAYIEAIADFSKLIEIDQKNAFAYQNRAISYENINEYQKAIADYTKAIELNPKDFFYYRRSISYYNTGEYQKAIDDSTSCLKKNPQTFICYEARANAYEKLGQKALADADRRKAKRLNQ